MQRLLSLVLLCATPLFAAPNVLVVIADDLGWGDVGYHGGVARTPNIDQLRRDGLELNRFYANPSCSPTRASFLTGRAALRLGLREQIGPNQDGLAVSEHLIAQSFRSAGYETALTGKWHIGSTTPDRLPNARGFDHFYGFLGPAIDYYTHLGENSPRLDWQRDGQSLNESGYSTDLIAAEEIRLLRARDAAKPFFHVVSFNAPHLPLEAPDDLKRNYPTLSADGATYAAMIESLDLAVGRLLAELTAQKIERDTLVVFFSDNGGAGMTPASNSPLRMAKGNVYDGGIRTPAILRWPGVLTAGQRSDQFIASMDLFPTIAAAAGVTPRNTLAFDGTNLWPELSGGTVRGNRSFTIVSAANTAQFEGNWKLVRLAQRDELYNIETDPSEANNQLNAQPAIAATLQASLAASVARLTGPETPIAPGRIVNIATRVQVGGTAGTPISGFVLGGTGTKRMLVRAVGPGLSAFGVAGALADPALSLVAGASTVATNDNWNAGDAATMTAAGAFAFTAGSRDAAIVSTLASGAYSSPVSANSGTGVALLEVYDAGSAADGPALVNASTRAFVGSGDQVLIPGFVISGTGSVKLLLRAVGPTLGSFGVSGVLADPQITLYRGATAVATNDNWSSASNATEVASATSQAGAFALTSGSRDAALLTTLDAGSYTAIVSGVGNTTGTALVELYVVP